MSTADEIIEQALGLPEKDRARLTELLLRSLDPPGEDISEEEWIAAWGPELERRALAYERGEIQAFDWRESLERVRESLCEQKKS